MGRTLLANRLGAAANRISYWVGSLYKLRGQPGNVMQLFIYLFLLLWCGKRVIYYLIILRSSRGRKEIIYYWCIFWNGKKEALFSGQGK